MLVKADKLFSELEFQLASLELENTNVLKLSELSFYACKRSVEELRTLILRHKFVTENEEIFFFKETKPLFTSRQTYHLMLFNIETRKPNGGKEILKKYFLKELEKLKHYFDYNIDFYKYYRAGATYLDNKYFIRNKFDIQLTLDGHIFEHDPRFSTTHDFKVAKVLAHDRLQVFIEKELNWLENRESNYSLAMSDSNKLTWTDSKVSLIEMVYALYAAGTCNRGAIDLKMLANSLGEFFHLELGEIYRAYAEIKQRKEPTKFLDYLREKLLKKIDEDSK